jgi:hypothetical protein
MHSQPKENIEKNDMQAKIDGMAAGESDEPLEGRLCGK